jgi:hypothetical protein
MKALQVLGFSKDLNASMKKERKQTLDFCITKKISFKPYSLKVFVSFLINGKTNVIDGCSIQSTKT